MRHYDDWPVEKQAELVDSRDACPQCGNREMAWLICADDNGPVWCNRCHTEYQPYSLTPEDLVWHGPDDDPE